MVSKNLVIHGDRVPVEDSSGPTVTTTSVPVSAEMAPSFRLVVYHVTEAGELVTDSVQVPVEGINRGRVSHVDRDAGSRGHVLGHVVTCWVTWIVMLGRVVTCWVTWCCGQGG